MKIRNMLPFLDTEEIDLLLEKAAESEVEGIRLEELLPFASSKKLTEVYRKMAASGNFNTSRYGKAAFFPFLPSEALHLIIEDYINGKTSYLPDSILPFLSSQDVKALMKYEIYKKFGGGVKKEEEEKNDVKGGNEGRTDKKDFDSEDEEEDEDDGEDEDEDEEEDDDEEEEDDE